MHTLTALLASLLPTAAYTLLIWRLDRYEKEPLPLLLAAFFWGSLPAVALAFVAGVMLGSPAGSSPLGPGMAWAIAPLVEEPIKAVALVALFVFARHEFDGTLDGIVYGALVGFGFAMTENLLFFLAYPDDFGTLFWLRSVVFGMNHALFTGVVGLALGAVRYAPQRWMGYAALGVALGVAVGLHTLHNYAVHQRLLGLALSWVVQLSGVALLGVVAVLSWGHERRWVAHSLDEELAQGLIGAADHSALLHPARRVQAHLRTLAAHGWRAYRRARRLDQLMIKLAFCNYQLARGDRHRSTAERDRMRAAIAALRCELAGSRADDRATTVS